MDCKYEVECIYVKPEVDIERSLVPEDSNLHMNTHKRRKKKVNGKSASGEDREKQRLRQSNYRNSLTPQQRRDMYKKRRMHMTLKQREMEKERQRRYRISQNKKKYNLNLNDSSLTEDQHINRDAAQSEDSDDELCIEKTKGSRNIAAKRERKCSMTEEERERTRAERRRYYHSMPEERRERIKAAQRERSRLVYYSMSEEKRQQRKAMHFTYLASLTEEQLEKRKAARRESVRKYRRSLTEEQREMMNAARRKNKNASFKRPKRTKNIINIDNQVQNDEVKPESMSTKGNGVQIDIKPDIKYFNQRDNVCDSNNVSSEEIKTEIKPEFNDLIIRDNMYDENQVSIDTRKPIYNDNLSDNPRKMILIDNELNNTMQKKGDSTNSIKNNEKVTKRERKLGKKGNIETEYIPKNTPGMKGFSNDLKETKRKNRGKNKAYITEEEREKKRAARRRYYHSLSEERREKFKAAQRERLRNVYYSMTDEQREQKKAMHFTYLASLTEEQLEKRKAARRESVRKYRRSLTEEQREVMKAARRKPKKPEA